MSALTKRLLLALSTPLLFSAVLAAEPATADARKSVRTNPFAQPLVTTPSVLRSGSASAGSTAATSVSQPALQLRGVLRAGADSFANVDGKIVGLDETVFGMRLKSVSETAAVFVRNGKNVELKVSSAPDSSEITQGGGISLEDSR